ncbi:MAG: helix-turn-helix transcriptional regulator [Gammaproteobacteria bacterium]|nr:helix-turn-helix transcriptional regulator [Gammaproteobacteria bacterium]
MNDESLVEKLGRTISRRRKIKEMSQLELAQRSGTSPMTIQRVEKGRGGGVAFDSFVSIAACLEYSLSELLFEVEKGHEESKKSDFRWENVIERINRLNPIHRDWIVKVIEDILDKP